MAASKKTAALGNVISATVKKDARLCGAFAAQRDSKYKPKAPTVPENTHVIMPGMRPAEAMAYNRGKRYVEPRFMTDVVPHQWEGKHAYAIVEQDEHRG